MTFKLIATGIASILLTGCVALSTPELEQSWQGRFSLIARSASQQENHSGRFTLTQANTDLTILDLKNLRQADRERQRRLVAFTNEPRVQRTS